MGNDNGDYVLAGFAGNKKVSGEIIHVPYVPVMLVETDEERTARVKGERAGKMFASVKLSNEDCRKRGKRGEIVASKVENGNTYTKLEFYDAAGALQKCVEAQAGQLLYFRWDPTNRWIEIEIYEESGLVGSDTYCG